MIRETDNSASMDDWDDIPVPDVSNLITEDDTPVDNQFSEMQMRLLTESLSTSWQPGIPFVAMANVGVYVALNRPAVVPDVLVTTGVSRPEDLMQKDHRAYLTWMFDGKVPEIVIEIVSNKKGEELGRKLREYAHIGVRWYAVFDPLQQIQDEALAVFELTGKGYKAMGTAQFPLGPGLGLELWEGEFERLRGTWLRWVDGEGRLLLTGAESAEKEKLRAEREKQRADRLAAKLRELGVDPE